MTKPLDYENRVEKVRKEMARLNLDYVVCQKRGSIAYLAGAFTPTRSAVIVPLQGEVVLTTQEYEIDRVRQETWIKDLRPWLVIGGTSAADVVIDFVRTKGALSPHIGLELSSSWAPGSPSAMDYIKYTSGLPNAKFTDIESTIGLIMMVKEDAELPYLRQAAEITDAGMEAAMAVMAPGVSELEVAGAAELAMRKLGNEWTWSTTGGTEISSGYRTAPAFGWITPVSHKIIQRNDLVRVDLHSMYNLYLGDLYCNFALGKQSAEMQKMAKVWQDVAEAMIAKIRPGVTCDEIARTALKVAENGGYGNKIVPVFGHGIGTDSCMPPDVVVNNQMKLETNTVFILVNCITQPGVGGLMLETPILVTEDGCEPMSHIPNELIAV